MDDITPAEPHMLMFFYWLLFNVLLVILLLFFTFGDGVYSFDMFAKSAM